LARAGEYRKAALALRELVTLEDSPAAWVALGDMLARARRPDDALHALRQALWRHRRLGADARARTVARLIVAIDPSDGDARRFAA
jgi:predicted Zn-dependent protease